MRFILGDEYRFLFSAAPLRFYVLVQNMAKKDCSYFLVSGISLGIFPCVTHLYFGEVMQLLPKQRLKRKEIE